jgi:16S rRNA pseudouridine516 synthase
MPSRTRLDRLVAASSGYQRRDVRLLLAQGRILVNGERADSINQVIRPFDSVMLDDVCLQQHEAVYLAMHKPVGVVSATTDAQHRTVLDVLRDHPEWTLDDDVLDSLHIVGRLDKNTSGLLLLTNDSDWSERLMSPEQKVAKVYQVTLAEPLDERYAPAFAAGMHFPYEDITTRPARLEIVSDYVASVTLTEGRYHQIKRMFGRFRNPVLALHRVSVGEWPLPLASTPGDVWHLEPTDESFIDPQATAATTESPDVAASAPDPSAG